VTELAAPPATGARLDADQVEHVKESRARAARRLPSRDRAAAFAMGGAFVASATALATALPSGRSPGAAEVLLLVAAYALTARATFEVRTGVVVPTQLILVPMLFVLPLGIVPLCVAAGLLLAQLPDFLRGRTSLDRVPLYLLSSAHSLGPVLVLALAGERGPSLGDWPLYVAALGAQFAFDFAISAGWEWLALGIRPSSQLRFMGWAYLVDAALAPVGLAVALAATRQPAAAVLVLPLVGLLAEFARERQVRIDHALELSTAYRGTALLLGDVIEADDAYTGSHSRDVVDLVRTVSERLGLSRDELRSAELVALLHDVGKIRIPAEIIRKPGPLTPPERALIETHTLQGEQMLGRVGGLLAEVGRIVRSCHERWDGRGYPDHLAGEEIPLVARIVCCCDAFDAMTSDRPYRPARTQAEALDELRACSGSQFDPAVVEAVAAVVDAG
jgi:HD-GYP domain-containing protein (c-di-GMP phosphodiesterase class II)